MVGTVIIVVVLVVGAFVAGALIYRNNTKKAEAIVVDMKSKYDELEKKYNDLKDKIGG